MPKLIRLYIISVAIGFAIALGFVSLIVWLDVAGLRHLVVDTELGWLAFVMMVMFNGIVFAGVQFAVAIMGMAEKEDAPKGGLRAPITKHVIQPAHIPVSVKPAPRPRRS